MKLILSGKTKEFTPEIEDRFSAKVAKLGKFLEQRGEREAHVTHQVERHLHKIEVVVNFYDHSLVGEGVDADLDTALCHAIEKLEKQIVKLKNRWRDTHRDAKGTRSNKESWDGTVDLNGATPSAPAAAVNGKNNGHPAHPKIFRVDYSEGRKPMTIEEAILDLQRDPDDDYAVYRDADRNCLSVLIRRRDGHFDLIES